MHWVSNSSIMIMHFEDLDQLFMRSEYCFLPLQPNDLFFLFNQSTFLLISFIAKQEGDQRRRILYRKREGRFTAASTLESFLEHWIGKSITLHNKVTLTWVDTGYSRLINTKRQARVPLSNKDVFTKSSVTCPFRCGNCGVQMSSRDSSEQSNFQATLITRSLRHRIARHGLLCRTPLRFCAPKRNLTQIPCLIHRKTRLLCSFSTMIYLTKRLSFRAKDKKTWQLAKDGRASIGSFDKTNIRFNCSKRTAICWTCICSLHITEKTSDRRSLAFMPPTQSSFDFASWCSFLKAGTLSSAIKLENPTNGKERMTIASSFNEEQTVIFFYLSSR